ncbi:vitelline membrane outer layer protein 1-like protein [Platysternon megacephalum]|uniref:Vitelline membrane outer layer protein 1-like protein n=1 Tax=Platysternon megacephalum TaxID=55544 RepID=A0A4D9DU12_9SAUR|nr:vitelline membrane outer layer protein 1-like protein [Platysternon megacephalum]
MKKLVIPVISEGLSANISDMFKPAGQHTRSIRKMMQSQPQHTVSQTARIRVQTVPQLGAQRGLVSKDLSLLPHMRNSGSFLGSAEGAFALSPVLRSSMLMSVTHAGFCCEEQSAPGSSGLS